MANNITNVITVTEGDFDEVATYVKSEKQNFDFNTLIPCPKEYEQFDGVSTCDEKAVAFWAAYFDNTQSAENKQASIKELLEIPKELFSHYFWNGLKRYKLWEKYGDFDSYYWCIRHWNCKWNASDSEIYAGKKTILFYTAWNAPFPIYKALAKKFPNHKFQVYFADLEGFWFAGKAVCEKENVVLLQNYGTDCEELREKYIKMVEEIISDLKNETI